MWCAGAEEDEVQPQFSEEDTYYNNKGYKEALGGLGGGGVS